MATASSGIWTHATAARPLPGAAAMDSPTTNSGSTATISANDFLSLLVTEMQNQDPTATTDPNEYINQLVNVNSLEQLIGINQTLHTAYPNASMSTGAQSATAAATEGGAALNDISSSVSSVSGNLSVPSASPAAQRIAQALSGR